MGEMKLYMRDKPDNYEIVWNEENIFYSSAYFYLPDDFSGIKFKVDVLLPENYPFKPPEMYLSPIFYNIHVNQQTGKVNMHYLANWAEGNRLTDLVEQLMDKLQNPDINYPSCDPIIVDEFTEKPHLYKKKVLQSINKLKAQDNPVKEENEVIIPVKEQIVTMDSLTVKYYDKIPKVCTCCSIVLAVSLIYFMIKKRK